MSYIGNQPTSVAFLTDQFSGNASTTAFTMSVAPATTSSILVAITGVVQDPSTYSIVGTTLTFSAAPPTGTGNISVRYLGIPASGVTTTAYRTVTEFTATAGQTTFTVPSYTVGYIDVYRNGVRLGSADYTATNGTTVVLAAGATAGDLVTTESFYVSSVLNAIPATSGSVGTSYLVDGSVTQAKLGSNVAGNGPAFSAYLSTNQTGITNYSNTKVNFQTEEFDTGNAFNNTGSTVGTAPAYSFNPQVAGYYEVNWCVQIPTPSSTALVLGNLYKNANVLKSGSTSIGNGSTYPTSTGSCIVYLNGSTDYITVQVWGYANGTTIDLQNGIDRTNFSAAFVRAA